MSATQIETMLWHIQREIMHRHGVDASERYIAPLKWYIGTGRACSDFLKAVYNTSPTMIARDLAKGGSYEDAINRVCKRAKYNRDSA